MSTTALPPCYNCKAHGASPRDFDWHYRPRDKDVARGAREEMRVFQVDLCSACYGKTWRVTVVRGWDWYEAYEDFYNSCFDDSGLPSLPPKNSGDRAAARALNTVQKFLLDD